MPRKTSAGDSAGAGSPSLSAGLPSPLAQIATAGQHEAAAPRITKPGKAAKAPKQNLLFPKLPPLKSIFAGRQRNPPTVDELVARKREMVAELAALDEGGGAAGLGGLAQFPLSAEAAAAEEMGAGTALIDPDLAGIPRVPLSARIGLLDCGAAGIAGDKAAGGRERASGDAPGSGGVATAEPPRPRCTWDYVLEEASLLWAAIESERKWKAAMLKKLVAALGVYFERRSKKALADATAEELRRRKRASRISAHVAAFWTKVDKLVIFKHKSRIEAKRRMAMDKVSSRVLPTALRPARPASVLV